MGCCFSKRESSKNIYSTSTPPPQKSNFLSEIPAWESDLHREISLEEETVKEVLSESPKRCSLNIKEDEKEEKNQQEEMFTVDEREDQQEGKIAINGVTDEIFEEVSEMYSLSECVSTTTVTEKRDETNENEVDQVNCRAMRIPASGSVPGRKRERDGEEIRKRTSQSPVRRRDPLPVGSPVKTAGKTVPGRNGGQMDRMRQGVEPAGKQVPGEVGVKKNAGRSRSPATRAESGERTGGLGRNWSRRGHSPGRIPAEKSPENCRKRADEDLPEESPANNNNALLENPLVSLECFIFL